MFEKLDEVVAKYEGLNAKLCEAEVISNRDLFLRLSKERAEVEELVETYRSYRAVVDRIAENRELLSDAELRDLAREELERDRPEETRLEERLKLLLLPRDPNDERNVLLEIRGGTGGEEASLFAADLFRLYTRFAERSGWRVETLSMSPSSTGGIKEAVALVSGDKVYSRLKFESGVHRVQRVPVTEAAGRIHTSTATVAVLPEAEEVDVQIADKDLRVEVMRAGGPGGQSVNTTDSAVRITHLPSGLVVYCQDEKSQHKNKAKALKILRSRLLEAEQERQDAERSEERRSQVGGAERAEKIRTYNFPQDRLTDHRIGFTRHNLQGVMDGDIQDLIDALRTHFQSEALRRASGEEAGAR
jgi:peptide chain release factor 1